MFDNFWFLAIIAGLIVWNGKRRWRAMNENNPLMGKAATTGGELLLKLLKNRMR